MPIGGSMRRKYVLRFSSVLVAGAGLAALNFAPLQASASTVKTAVIKVSPDTSCSPSSPNLLMEAFGDGGTVSGCGVGTVTLSGDWEFYSMNLLTPDRIWFHQNANGTGWADCFERKYPTGGVAVTGRDANPGNIQISSNTASC